MTIHTVEIRYQFPKDEAENLLKEEKNNIGKASRLS